MDAEMMHLPSDPLQPHLTTKQRETTKLKMKQEKKSVQTKLLSDTSAQILSRKEVALFRNSPKQYICVEMLKEGYHRSFWEFFSLLTTDRDQRAAAEPGSRRLQNPSLEEQQDKMETLKLHLIQAEQAETIGSWTVACEQRLLLGRYFSAPEDLWLRLHFYQSCVNTEQGYYSRPVTEARICLAKLYLQRGDLEEARLQAELCYEQTKECSWLDSDGQPLKLQARRTLWRVHSRESEVLLGTKEYSKALRVLQKSYSMATECEDKEIEGEVAFRLGLTYQSAGNHDMAKQSFNTCMQICGTRQDAGGLAEAYKATAKILEREGNIEETIRSLEKLADICHSSGLPHTLVDACLSLANTYYNKSQYTSEVSLQAYEVACNLKDTALLQKAQVTVARARAHSMVRQYIADVVSASPAALRRLLVWRETRRWQDLGSDSADCSAEC